MRQASEGVATRPTGGKRTSRCQLIACKSFSFRVGAVKRRNLLDTPTMFFVIGGSSVQEQRTCYEGQGKGRHVNTRHYSFYLSVDHSLFSNLVSNHSTSTTLCQPFSNHHFKRYETHTSSGVYWEHAYQKGTERYLNIHVFWVPRANS